MMPPAFKMDCYCLCFISMSFLSCLLTLTYILIPKRAIMIDNVTVAIHRHYSLMSPSFFFDFLDITRTAIPAIAMTARYNPV